MGEQGAGTSEISKFAGIIEDFKAELLNNLAEYHLPSAEHSLRVGRICQQMGKALNLPTKDQVVLVRAGLLHDIGKIIIPIHILNCSFTESEESTRDEYFEIIHKHPQAAYQMLKDHDLRVAQIILAHHQFQKKPYPPDKVNLGEDKTLAILLALIDQVDAMMTKRYHGQIVKTAEQTTVELIKYGWFSEDWIKKVVSLRLELGQPI